jgi:hypothetical protein
MPGDLHRAGDEAGLVVVTRHGLDSGNDEQQEQGELKARQEELVTKKRILQIEGPKITFVTANVLATVVNLLIF